MPNNIGIKSRYKIVELKDTKKIHKELQNFEIHKFITIDHKTYHTGAGLLYYIQTKAFEDIKTKHNMVYLIRNRFTNEIVAYFGLKAAGIKFIEFDEHHHPIAVDAPAVELTHFAINDKYREQEKFIYVDALGKKQSQLKGLGSSLFEELILPKIKKLQHHLGIQQIIIFSLNYAQLIENYASWGFLRDDGLAKYIHPEYDVGCVMMFRSVQYHS